MKNKSQKKLAISVLISILVIAFLMFLGRKQTHADSMSSWLNDSLDIDNNDLRKSGRWIDTITTNMAFALYRGDTCILRNYFIGKKAKDDVQVYVTNLRAGSVEIRPIDTLDYNGEYFIVTQGILGIYNKEGKRFAKAIRLLEYKNKN